LIYTLTVIVVTRFGLLALAVAVFVNGVLASAPTLQTSAWYFPNTAVLLFSALALAAWAFYAATGGRIWKQDLFN
jgi:hypothetical protein